MNKREITIPMRSLAGKTLNLGYVGENLHTRIIIDCTEELCDYPTATINMAIRSPHGDIYPVQPEKDGWRAIWDVTGSDLVYAGSGQIQVTLMDGEEIIKSAVGSFTTSASLETTGPAPEPLQNWMDAAEQTAAQIAEDAAEGVVDDLADAKDEAIAAIEAKGEEVIEEIPADYTQLSEDVSNVKSAIVPNTNARCALVDKLNKNRFDGITFPGYLLSDGSLSVSGDWVTTDLIYIGDLENIICSGNTISTGTRANVGLSFICSYDNKGNFIEQIGTSYAERYTVTSGVAFIRFSYHADTFNQIQVEGGNTRTTYQVYDYDILPEKVDEISGNVSTLNADVIELNTLKSSFEKTPGKNRFDRKTDVGYLNASGELTSGSDWVTTDYIFVGDLYRIIASGNTISTGTRGNLGLSFLCTYNYNKTFIEQVGTNYGERYLVESGVAYIRFSYHANTTNQVQVESGYFRSDYAEYADKNTYNSKWYGKNWVAVGDSLTEVNTRTTMHYHDFIAAKTGINVINMGVSGSGYAKKSDTNQAFYQRISNVPQNADVITIFGSGNDGSSGIEIGTATDTGTTTLCGCVNTTLDNLFSVLPLANVGIISPTPWIDQPPYNTTNFMTKYSAALKSICELRGIPFLDLYHCSGLRPWEESYRNLCYTHDEGNGVHPDETGHRIIASKFEAFLDNLLLH